MIVTGIKAQPTQCQSDKRGDSSEAVAAEYYWTAVPVNSKRCAAEVVAAAGGAGKPP